MKLIVGLGNPEEKYENTFHNLGFMCLDALANELGISFRKNKCRALLCEEVINGEKVLFCKPQTYMNLSGESVRELLNYYKIAVKDLLVVFDDFDLPIGTVRFRESGSAGTHNGIRNIVKEINTEGFARVKIGFKPLKENNIPLIDYVLSGIGEQDKKVLSNSISTAVKAVKMFIENKPFDIIKQTVNGKANN